MAMILNGTGDITGLASVNSSVTAAEIGYLDGVTSALQTQLGGKADILSNGAWASYTPTWSADREAVVLAADIKSAAERNAEVSNAII